MLIRSSRLPKNQSAGCLDETPLRTVHQRPPKKIAPSKRPATNASARVSNSFIVILLFVPHALSSSATQCHAFKQPIASPATSSASVQACLPGWCLSNQIPSAAPRSVGTATDQPMSPIMPKPNQTPCVELRALSLRAALAPTCAAKVGSFFKVFFGSSFMLKGRESTQKSSFQFSYHLPHALLVFVQGQEFLFHRIV